ncbi:MAG: trigger factor [bacterium]
MTSTFEKLSSNKVKLSFVVEPEKFAEGLKAAYNKLKGRFNVPGFRRGKAPMKVIENFYGVGVFYEDALDAIFPEIYREGLKEHDVQVVSSPEVNVEQIGRGQELKFTVEVFVRPDVKLGAYTGLGLVKTVDEVTEDDVSAEIERARDRASRWVEISDRPAQLDDQVNIDYQGFDGDVQFDGGTAQGHDLLLGSGSFIPGFEDQLVGKSVGEECDVNVTFPEDYHAKELAGKPVVFKVKINSIRQKEVPELDDDFVKEASETADTVEEYRAEIREKLMKAADERAESAFENEIIETVCENAEVDIPDAMIDDQIDSMLRDMEMRMAYQGIKMADYFKYTGQTEAQVRDIYRQQATEQVKSRLVIEAIGKAENITATEEEIDAEMEKYAQQNKKTLEEFKQMVAEEDRGYFSDAVVTRKTFEFLKAHAE